MPIPMLSPGSPLVRWLPFVGQREGFVQQHSMVVLADVKPDELKALNQTLEQIRQLLWTNQTVLFHNTKTVHYATWLVLPSFTDEKGRAVPHRLVLETNYDGELDAHLDDLITECGTAFDQVYRHCAGYPAGGCTDRSSVLAYLKGLDTSTNLKPTAYYVALPGRTLEDIRNAIYVYEESRKFVDANARGRAHPGSDHPLPPVRLQVGATPA